MEEGNAVSRDELLVPTLAPPLHVLAQRLVHSRLVAAVLSLEPGEHVGVHADADRLLDRPEELAADGVGPMVESYDHG